MERRLTAILAADFVGFSRLIGRDEEGTITTLKSYRKLIDDLISNYGGRVFGSAGDSVIAEFTSATDASRCALEIQRELKARNLDLPEKGRMNLRIGIHLGDVVADGDNLLGDGINIASRLEATAPPGGICVSKAVADQLSGKVDAEFAHAGAHELKNIANKVEVWTWPPELAVKPKRSAAIRWTAATAVVATVTAISAFFVFGRDDPRDLPSGARIVITPFETIGENKEDEYFAEGLTRDLNALLAKFSNLFVIAPEAGADFSSRKDCEAIRDALGADYILGGTAQRSDSKLRVTTTFINARTCRQLTPPGPFDMDLSIANVLDIQVEIARKVASQIGSSDAPLFNASVQQAIRDKAPENLEAYECYLLGFWFYQSFSIEAHRKARDCLLRTVKEEPGYSLAWSRLAFNYLESKKRSFDTDPDWANKARDAATRALEEDPDNADAHYALAILSRMTGEDKAVFFEHAKNATELSPNDSWILADLGIFLAYSGEFEKGKEWISRAKDLNPKLHPGYNNAWVLHAILQGNYDEAQKVILSWGTPKSTMSMASLTASYALDGEQQKAQEMARRLQNEHPEFLDDPRAPYRARGMPTELIEKIMGGLRIAGIEVSEN